MADLLVRHLQKKGEQHSSLSLLVNQWGFDEKIIPKALQTIGSLFPHYSRHDESHSKQILVNIERILGEGIELLTATDTWLILEAAYWHDIGMVVSHSDIGEAVADPGFQAYVDQIAQGSTGELSRFAKNFNSTNIATCFSGADSPLDAVTKFRELVAEWFRRKHPTRAESIVGSPFQMAGINSPRTELIPARLFRLLGRVCQMHGAAFDSILDKNGLPFREAGLAQEDCHPRFVACLLRMGDLLDMDDNRFCPVMKMIAGDNRPLISRAHEDKHAGIRHLRIDRERIEVSAECETIDGYLEAFKWFDWLKKEMREQMAHWRDIVPDRALGLLPTLGPISLSLKGELQVLKEGERPQFEVEQQSIIKLLQGDNLYADQFACIREILQNAVDATLLRVWLSAKNTTASGDWENPFSPEVVKNLENGSISVTLSEIGSEKGREEKSEWLLRIQDKGTGISRADLAYMLRIGGSQKNASRQKAIAEMPEWMKPSGAFGIGLQSAFMLCDEIRLTTKSIFTHEALDITMHSPSGERGGLVLIKSMPEDPFSPCGTAVELKFGFDKFSKYWSTSTNNELSIAKSIANQVDPVLDQKFPYQAGVLADKIVNFSTNSLIPIESKFNLFGDGVDFKLDGGAVEMSESKWKFFSTEFGQFKICYEVYAQGSRPSAVDVFYRGQELEFRDVYIPYAKVQLDLMSGVAGSWLNFNRDKLTSAARDDVAEIIIKVLELAVREDLESEEFLELLNEDERSLYSLFLESMAVRYVGSWQEFARKLSDAWQELAAPGGETYKRHLEKDSLMIGTASHLSDGAPLKGCDFELAENWVDPKLEIILSRWMRDGRSIKILAPHEVEAKENIEIEPVGVINHFNKSVREGDLFRLRYYLNRERGELCTDAALAMTLFNEVKFTHGNSMAVLVTRDAWSDLHLKPGTKLRAHNLLKVHPPGFGQVLLPFLFLGVKKAQGIRIQVTKEQLRDLVEWVAPNLISGLPKNKILERYLELIQYIDEKIMRDTVFESRWKSMRGLDSELPCTN